MNPNLQLRLLGLLFVLSLLGSAVLGWLAQAPVKPVATVSGDSVLAELPRARAGDPAALGRLAALVPVLQQMEATGPQQLANRLNALLAQREALQTLARGAAERGWAAQESRGWSSLRSCGYLGRKKRKGKKGP